MDIWLLLFVSTAFVSAVGITFSVGHLITSRNRLQRRLPAGATMSDALNRRLRSNTVTNMPLRRPMPIMQSDCQREPISGGGSR